MPPPIPSMPYARTSLYQPRYGDTIAQLLTRQGDIAAQGAERSGQIWGQAIGQLGQIGGQAFQAINEQKQQERMLQVQAQRSEAFNKILETWDGKDKKQLFKGLSALGGPEWAVKVGGGVVALMDQQKNKEPDPEKFQMMVGGLRGIVDKMGTTYIEQNWPSLRAAFAPGASAFLGWEIPEQYAPELGQQMIEGIKALDDKWSTPEKPAAGFELSPGQTRFDASGKPIASLPPSPEKPKALPEPSFQAKEVLNDEGKPVMANFDARTGRYVDPSTGKPIKNPRPVPSAAETQDSRKFQQAGPILRSVSELSEKINTLQGVYATAAGATARAKAKINLDDDVAEYEALISGFTPLVARALGHTGVLTQQDVDSVRALFPRPEDSKSLRDRKVKRIKSIIGELEGGTPTGSPQTTVGRFKVEVE